jgi:putative transposase
MDKATHEMRIVQWTEIIRQCNNSGISKRTWCENNNVDEKQFYYWQRRIREEVFNEIKKPDLPRLVELKAPVHKPVGSENPDADAVLHFGSYSVSIKNSLDPGLLEKILMAVSNVK